MLITPPLMDLLMSNTCLAVSNVSTTIEKSFDLPARSIHGIKLSEEQVMQSIRRPLYPTTFYSTHFYSILWRVPKIGSTFSICFDRPSILFCFTFISSSSSFCQKIWDFTSEATSRLTTLAFSIFSWAFLVEVWFSIIDFSFSSSLAWSSFTYFESEVLSFLKSERSCCTYENWTQSLLSSVLQNFFT